MTPTPLPADTLTPDGHLTTLSLERHLAGEIDAAPHLDTCADCSARWVALQADAAAFALRPPAAHRSTGGAASRWPIVAVALSAAAALAFFVLRPDPALIDDGVRVKGGFALEVHVEDGAGSRLLLDGDAVSAGDRLGFRVKSDVAGHLLILGRDGADAVWRIWPQPAAGSSAPFGPTEMRDLGQAVVLDATPGDERLTALLCAAPVEQSAVAPILARGEIPTGCRARRITLRKQP